MRTTSAERTICQEQKLIAHSTLDLASARRQSGQMCQGTVLSAVWSGWRPSQRLWLEGGL